jgi:ketosteroid isomerase-like protein
MPETQTILAFLEGYAAALNAGDIPTVTQSWALPALILANEGARPVAAAEEVERFFEDTIAWYRAQGITLSPPEIVRTELLAERLASVDVRWASLDAAGAAQSWQTSRYILDRFSDDRWRFRVAVAVTPA